MHTTALVFLLVTVRALPSVPGNVKPHNSISEYANHTDLLLFLSTDTTAGPSLVNYLTQPT